MHVTTHNNAGERLVIVREDADDAPIATFVRYGDRLRYVSGDRARGPRRAHARMAMAAAPGATYAGPTRD